jgi:hypothetical protein
VYVYALENHLERFGGILEECARNKRRNRG